eukprot:gene4080-2928_t
MTKGKGKNPGAGNLNKHIKRKEHQERSQPAYRKHLGELEKHKDHALRARKRRLKQQKLLQLKRGAAQRNPDEFHIGMTKAVMDIASGRVKKRRVSLTADEKKSTLMKTINTNRRNLQYLEYKAEADRQRAKDILDEDAASAFTTQAPRNKHVVFVENEDEFKKFNPLKHFDWTPEMLKQHPAVRGTKSVLQNTVLPEEVLLGGGNPFKSTAQRRKERREIQFALHKSQAEDEEDRAKIVERLKTKRDLKQYRFSDIVSSVAAASSPNPEEEEEDATDEVSRLLDSRKEKAKEQAVVTARRMKEVAQRMERSRSLSALAKVVKRQNVGIKAQLQQRERSRFKPGVPRRSR